MLLYDCTAPSNNPFESGAGGGDLFASPAAPGLASAQPTSSLGGMDVTNILQPQVMGEFGTKEPPKQQAGLGKDLDSSLSIAAEGLSKFHCYKY